MKQVKLPCKIGLTRLSTRKLDDDNLVGAFKWIRDEIADCLIPGQAKGRADGDQRLSWEYRQQKSPLPRIRVEIHECD